MKTESGELIVSEKSHAEIGLCNRPRHVEVYFKDDQHINNCDPGSADELKWRVHERHRCYYLDISWDVSASRIIFWKAE